MKAAILKSISDQQTKRAPQRKIERDSECGDREKGKIGRRGSERLGKNKVLTVLVSAKVSEKGGRVQCGPEETLGQKEGTKKKNE